MSLCSIVMAFCLSGISAEGPSVAGYATIQEALDANPGKVVEVPAGDHEIHETIRIATPGGGLSGTGRIIQADPSKAIVRIDHADGVLIRGLTFTRPEGRQETEAQAVVATDSRDVTLADLRVIDNQGRSATIELRRCEDGRVVGCLVQNYQRIGVDDRTDSPDNGYAFRCVIGTGILVAECRGTLVQGNTIREDRLVATPELKRTHELGKFIKKNAVRGRLVGVRDWERGETDNWMQGTAVHIASPESTDFTRVLGNHVERAGQGFDIHADRVILAQNTVDDALIGMKAMHGSRHVVVMGNQFARNSLWSIGLMPGAASHRAKSSDDGSPASAANVDGGSIIANNIISDFGRGVTRWIWGGHPGYPLRFDHGQLPDNPPLTDVVVQGNVVYASDRDDLPVAAPSYRFAVMVEGGPTAPVGLHFSNNIFHPGSEGISNVELKP